MEETAVVIYVHKVCTKFTKQNSSNSFFNLLSLSYRTLPIMNREVCAVLLSLRILSKKQKEIRKQFQSFGFTDK
jgi:hypothetical protein